MKYPVSKNSSAVKMSKRWMTHITDTRMTHKFQSYNFRVQTWFAYQKRENVFHWFTVVNSQHQLAIFIPSASIAGFYDVNYLLRVMGFLAKYGTLSIILESYSLD